MKYPLLSVLIVCCLFGAAQKATNQKPFTVTIREQSEPDMLHPANYQTAVAGTMLNLMFQSLTEIDPYTLQEIPVLAKTLPVVSFDTTKQTANYTYQIREEARWDNGTPITAADVAFTIKFIKCPAIQNDGAKPYFEKVTDVILYPENPKKVTVVCTGLYILNPDIVGHTHILPQYLYDENGLLNNYTLQQLAAIGSVNEDEKLREYGEKYNDEKYQRDAKFIAGSGAYRLSEWISGARLKFERKKNWWPDPVPDGSKSKALQAYPDAISYVIIIDEEATITALKKEQVDVAAGITPVRFINDVRGNAAISKNYNTYTPNMFSYSYIGINMNKPLLHDERVRQALAHLVNVDTLLQTVALGLGTRITGPFSPLKTGAYNDTLKPYAYNIEKAVQLLEEAGWAAKNETGLLTKEVDGETVTLDLEILYPHGSTQREKMALLVKESARSAGINLTATPVEWTVLLERMQHHDFDLIFGAWLASASLDDPRQLWHTNSVNGGSNYVYFGTMESDVLIDNIVIETDTTRRNHLYRRLHEIIYHQVPYIFLWSPKEKLAIHKRFAAVEPFATRPGYNPAWLQLSK